VATSKAYDSYPGSTVILSNLVTFSIYILGLLIILKIWWVLFFIYLGFILAMEVRLIRSHCTICYYWGRICGFGKGKLSSLFFKKGDTLKFCKDRVTWKDMVPDLIISLLPVVAGIILLILKFNILLFIALVILIVLISAGNAYVRKQLTCSYCKQRELGCPAEKLFSKE
jgi:hypothetical protein